MTTVAQSMLDLAAVSEHDPVAVRVALARLDSVTNSTVAHSTWSAA